MNRSLGLVLLLVVAVALGVAGAVVYTAQSSRDYTSTARIFIGLNAPTNDRSEIDNVYAATAPAEDFAKFARSEDIAALVTAQVGGGIEAIKDAVDVHVVEDTTLLDISATDRDPRHARDLAGAYAEVVAQQLGESETTMTGSGQSGFITRVIDPPADAAHLEPRPWWRNLGIGAGVGLLLGLALASWRGSRSNRPTPAAG